MAYEGRTTKLMTAQGSAVDDSGDEKVFEFLPSPLAAVDDQRAAARWTLAAAGAVGAVLVSGGPLVAVGRVHGFAHAAIAGAGLLVALCGVALAIWQTSRVLAPRLTTTADLTADSLAGLRDKLGRSPAYTFGTIATSITDLLSHREIAVSLVRQLASENDPVQRTQIRNDLRRVTRNAARAAPYVRWLLATAHAWQIAADLRRARWCVLAGGVLVVVGAVLLFSVTGGGPDYVPVVTPQFSTIPTIAPSAATS
jgi:hypothetical protein